MKTLRHLEQKRYIWFLITISTLFFLLRLPSFIEPYWYGDEGIYQVISHALQNGRQLYTQVWDNKPPLLYITYMVFSGDQFSIRIFSTIVGLFTVVIYFFLAKLLLGYKAAVVATLTLVILFATPYLEGNIANAENFILLPIITAALLTYSISKQSKDSYESSHKKLLIAGFLLGLAFLFKIVAFFDFLALFTTMYLFQINTLKLSKKSLSFLLQPILNLRFYIAGFLIPVVFTFLYFTIQGTLYDFIQSAFFGNISYVGYGNAFIIPQGFLILKLLVFFIALVLIVSQRNILTKPVMFILVWFVYALFSAFFSQRPYTHYLLMLLPTFCLIAGLLLSLQNIRAKVGIILLLISLTLIATNYFNVYGITKTFAYYQNTLQFLSGSKSVTAYQSFFDWKTPRDYEVVSYINTHSLPEEQIFLWGDSPQIYALTHKLPPGKYTVAYHIMEHENAVEETQVAIDKVKPKFIITLSEAPPLPFYLPDYAAKYGIKGAAIYERTY